MARRPIQQTVVTDTGDVIPSAQVEIRRESDNGLVSLFDAITGGSPVTNPFNCDAEGFFRVYAEAPEVVKITATGAGGDVEFRNVILPGTAADADLYQNGGTVTEVGDFGWGVDTLPLEAGDTNDLINGAWYAGGTNKPVGLNTPILSVDAGGLGFQFGGRGSSDFYGRLNQGGYADWVKFYHTGNNIDARDYGYANGLGIGDFNQTNVTTKENRIYSGSFGAANGASFLGNYQTAIQLNHWILGDYCTQILTGTDDSIGFRTMLNGVWQSHIELYHTGNYQPETSNGLGIVKRMQYINAVGIADGATTSGSSLRSVRQNSSGAVIATTTPSGTWKNVTGTSIFDTEMGDFVRIA